MQAMPRPKNDQQAFNNVVRWFFELGKARAYGGNDGSYSCAYRLKKNKQVTACAIGCQLPDKLYDARMEGTGVEDLFTSFPKVRHHFKDVSEVLLGDLQTAHDDAENKRDLRRRLIEVAMEHNLKIPEALRG